VSGNICALAEITDASAGGKAYGLARLVAMGLPVPPAFVLRNAVAGRFPDALEQKYFELGKAQVAVRSSALGEDGGEASFAGQYDTVLNVCGVEQLRSAIERCVSSAANEHARSYQQTHNDGNAIAMNVVVQAMVNARVAGVVFTADPVSGRRDLLVMDVVAGLGEALVSGKATPDHYGVLRTGVHRGGGRSGQIVQRQLVGAQPLLSDEEITAIATQAWAAAEHEGHPLDLEWAIDEDGTLFWFQADYDAARRSQRIRYAAAAPR
jgi:phosphoenolpyruvate synthase/pyruvate phosphate dikinase